MDTKKNLTYIVIYSSVTGNTKQVAEAIADELPQGTPCVRVQDAPEDLSGYDVVCLGFWANQLQADALAQTVLTRIHNDKVALFMTCGVPPMMKHAKDTMAAAISLLPEGQTPIDTFICQGKMDPKVIALMYKKFPKGHPHGQSKERDERHKKGATHPDANDIALAKEFARRI